MQAQRNSCAPRCRQRPASRVGVKRTTALESLGHASTDHIYAFATITDEGVRDGRAKPYGKVGVIPPRKCRRNRAARQGGQDDAMSSCQSFVQRRIKACPWFELPCPRFSERVLVQRLRPEQDPRRIVVLLVQAETRLHGPVEDVWACLPAKPTH